MFASEIFGWCFHKGRILEKFRLVEASALGLHTLKRNHLAPFGRSRYMFMYMFMYMYIEYRYIYTYISSNYALLSYLRSLSYLSSFLPYFLGKKKTTSRKNPSLPDYQKLGNPLLYWLWGRVEVSGRSPWKTSAVPTVSRKLGVIWRITPLGGSPHFVGS